MGRQVPQQTGGVAYRKSAPVTTTSTFAIPDPEQVGRRKRWTKLPPDWFRDRGCIGVDICCAYPRGEDKYAFQITDRRLVPCFSRRVGVRTTGVHLKGWKFLRQYTLPCKSEAKAKARIMAAITTLPEYEEWSR